MDKIIDTTFYPTVSELMMFSPLKECHLLAGHSGLHRIVTGFHLNDISKNHEQFVEGEMLIISHQEICYNIISTFLPSLIPQAARNHLSAIFIDSSQLSNSILDIMTNQAEDFGIPLFNLPLNSQPSDIARFISQELLRRQSLLLEKILSVNNMLVKTILEGSGLDNILRIISELTGSSAMILDTVNQRRSLYIAPTDKQVFSNLSEEATVQKLIQGGRTHKIGEGDSFWGYLYLYGKDLSTYLDADILIQILHIIPLEITREQNLCTLQCDGFSDFLLHILSDQIIDENWEITRANKLGLEVKDIHTILRIKISNKIDCPDKDCLFQRAMMISSIKSLFKIPELKTRIVCSDDEYIILLSAPKNNQLFPHLTTQLSNLAGTLFHNYPALLIAIGCGCPHANLSGIAQSNREACIALRASQNCKQQLLCFENLGILRLIYADHPNYEISAYVTETLQELTDDSQSRNKELLRTLEYYLKYQGNLQRVSKEMFTHYNTVVYRLKKIKELTGLDPRNSKERFRLELALNLYYTIPPNL